MPSQPLDLALDHYTDRQSLVGAIGEVAGQMWADVNPARIVDSWVEQIPELTAITAGAQLGAARQADDYTTAVLDAQDVDAGTVAQVDPSGFAGVASDGRGLATLLANPVIVTLLSIQDGMDIARALGMGRVNLDMLVRTQVADAGRLADQAALTARPRATGYVRMAVGGSCARCLLLSGKEYRYNAGFQRHPRCDCIGIPKGDSRVPGIRSPEARYAEMSPGERTRAGFTRADQRALAEGADLGQVVNARRGLYTAGGRRFTHEGTTKRGVFGSIKENRGRPRLSVDQILQDAVDRDDAVRLLQRNGYLLQPAPVPALNVPSGAAGGAGEVQRLAVRPALTGARTLAEVNAAFTAEAMRLTGRPIRARLQGSIDTAREHAEGVLRGLEIFPDAALDEIRMFNPKTSAKQADAYAFAHERRIQFSGRFGGWSVESRREAYLQAVARDVRTRFHPAGTGSPTAIAIHEFGHILDIDTLARSVAPDVDRLVRRRAAAAGLPTAQAVIERDISRYAAESMTELMAEAFVDVLVNGAAASQLSREIVDLLEKAYRRGGRRTGAPGRGAAAPTGPDNLSKLTVRQLRELAKVRGIKIPSKALKADIVRLLEQGATPPLTGAAKRAAARLRQAEIDRRSAIGDLLAEFDELISKSADRAVFAQRLDFAAVSGVDTATVDVLRRALDDRAKLRAAMTRAGNKAGVKAVGRAGQRVKFDGALHDPVGDLPPAGATVVVVRRGTTLSLNGETITLAKAQVSPVIVAASKKAAAGSKFYPGPLPTPVADLAAAARRRPTEARRLGGSVAVTERLTYRDGTMLVRKTYGARSQGARDTLRENADAEQLGAMVVEAVGGRVPTVYRTGNTIYMRHVDGKTGEEIVPWGQAVSGSIVNSDDGRLIGLADVLMGHTDRNDGNWIRSADGRLTAIDHGYAFTFGDMYGNHFARHFVDPDGAIVPHDMARADVDRIRVRLMALQAAFDQLGRGAWYRQMMARLDKLSGTARGQRARLR